MITIRSSSSVSAPALISFEAIVTTQGGIYEFSSDGLVLDSTSPFSGGLFGSIAWPRSRFQIRPGLVIEQQMFVSDGVSDIAISWELRGELAPAQLVVRPYFTGCAPRGYRDTGFHFESEQQGGRLVWLPTVRGPKIIADTNGQYADEPLRLTEEIATSTQTTQQLIAPGRFEFELNRHPSILILSSEGRAKTQTQQFVGAFLANLMQRAPASIELDDPALTVVESPIAA